MSFGSPGGGTNFAKPIPPERGSFPLDHDNECKMHMASYLTCLKKAKGVNVDDCRMLSKAYLQCRMDRNLMAQDEMKNLGFANPTITKEEVHESVLEREQDTKKFKEQVANGK